MSKTLKSRKRLDEIVDGILLSPVPVHGHEKRMFVYDLNEIEYGYVRYMVNKRFERGERTKDCCNCCCCKYVRRSCKGIW